MRLGDIQGYSQFIMRFSVIFILFLVFVQAAAVSCSPRVYPVQRDTVTVTNTVEKIVYRDSLIEVPVPQGGVSSSGHVSDTTDIIETSLAVSGVEIKGFQFRHWLRHKADAVILHPVKLPCREIETTRDNRILVRDVQLVEKELSWWQKTVQFAGYAAMAGVLILTILKCLKWARILQK